jgi:predicted nucleic acid-binding protein
LIVYPDSSFLMSAYQIDVHTPKVLRRLTSQPSLLVTQFHRAEIANAIFQQVFRGTLAAGAARRAFDNFDQDCAAGIWMLADHPQTVFEVCADLAVQRVGTLGVRTLDTLHVAAALELKADRFWTFDERQARLAEAEGLVTS